MKKVIFDSFHVESVDQLHRELARILDFPAHYGGNLDALYDCLSGEISLPLVFVWKNYYVTRSKLGRNAEEMLEVMKEFADEDPEFRIEVE